MRSHAFAFGLVMAMSLASLAGAQTLRPLVAAPARAPGALSTLDPPQLTINRLQSRVQRLENKTTALQATLDQMSARSTYTCVDPATSRNGAGVSEDCTPLGCNPIDGRCRIHASGSEQCAPGYLWDGAGQCVHP